MYIQFCFAVFISAATFVTSENNGDAGVNIAAVAKANVRADSNGKNETDERENRAISSSDRDTIHNTFNCQRSLVGASDMNYLSWSTSLETDTNNYVEGCNFDAPFYTSTPNSFILKYLVSPDVGHTIAIEYFFTTSTYNNGVTSRYLLQVSGGYKYCATAIAQGSTRSNAHFYAYGISATSQFNQLVRQYTPGNACTGCQGGVNWCYSNELCRGDCNNSTSGCCPITNNIPAQCQSSNLLCNSSSEIKASVMLLAIVSVFYSCFI